MPDELYQTGTIAVTAGQKAFAGTGTLWLPSNVKAKDMANVAGHLMMIESIDVDTQTGLWAIPYPGSTATGLSYAFAKTSSEWGTNRTLAVQTAELIRLLTVGQQFEWVIALSHEDGQISEGAAILTVPIPKNIEVQDVFAHINEPSTSGNIAIDLNINGVSALSTEITIEQGENSSLTAATQPVILNANWGRGDVLTIDFDTAGVNAAGAKVIISGQRRS
jgi:hypothetical protein